MKNTKDLRDQNKNTTTPQVITSDSCTMCPWLDKQPEGNKMLCILPGNCFWRAEWLGKKDG